MTRGFNEPWDPEDVLDPEAAANHRAEQRTRQAGIDARQKFEDDRAAEAKANALALTLRANLSVRNTEYLSRGVKPPFVGSDGMPTVSLSWLLREGWTIESVGDVNTLVRPPAAPAHERRRKEDYEGST